MKKNKKRAPSGSKEPRSKVDMHDAMTPWSESFNVEPEGAEGDKLREQVRRHRHAHPKLP